MRPKYADPILHRIGEIKDMIAHNPAMITEEDKIIWLSEWIARLETERCESKE